MKRLVLCSGGIKSTFLTELASREGEVALCFFNNKQPSSDQEYKAVRRLADRHDLNINVLYTGLQPGASQAPLLKLLLFFSYALPVARSEYCNAIYYGMSKDDEPPLIADTRKAETFLVTMQALLAEAQPLYAINGSWLGTIEIETPLRRLRGEHVIRLGNEWMVPWEETWSCEAGGAVHCGVCGHCRRRQQAFQVEGRRDPTTYARQV